MLILSRKSGEAIVFPSLDITVTVSRIRGKCVTLGVEAPGEVKILRKELVPTLQQVCSERAQHGLSHRLRNKLNSVGLSLNVLLRQMEAGRTPDSMILSNALADLHALDESLAPDTAPAKLPSKPETQQRLALLVEDNENESSLLSAFLREHGYQVVNALDGEAALSFLEYSSVNPDIVLLDMNMPGMDGPETVKIIRKQPQLCSMKLFAVSGMAPGEVDCTVGADGVDRWFRKPIEPDELVQQIDRDLAAA